MAAIHDDFEWPNLTLGDTGMTGTKPAVQVSGTATRHEARWFRRRVDIRRTVP